jgi:hypothetical protein
MSHLKTPLLTCRLWLAIGYRYDNGTIATGLRQTMQDEQDLNGDNAENSPEAESVILSRRRALMLGAVTASMVVSVRPALAQAAGSVLNCEIPVPGPHGNGMNIAGDGSLVPASTPGSFVATGQRYTGEQVKAALGGRSLPGASYEQSQAYVNYIRRLQYGQSGFTCYASLQMPR